MTPSLFKYVPVIRLLSRFKDFSKVKREFNNIGGSTVRRYMSSSSKMDKKLVILDVDTGVDDAQAIMMAVTRPELQVLAITVANGNNKVDECSINTLKVLQAWDKLEIPVYKGCDTSLINHNPYPDYVGDDGFGNVPISNPPNPELLQKEDAVSALTRLAHTYPGQITLVAMAPLTNLATSLRCDPLFGSKLKETIIMGGNIEENNPRVEFNFEMDPEAAKIVLEEMQCPVTLVPMSTCRQTTMSWDWVDTLFSINTPKGNFHSSIQAYRNYHMKQRKRNAYYSCDPTAMSLAIDDGIILESEDIHCTVDTSMGPKRGQVLANNPGIDAQQMVRHVKKIDVHKLQKLFEDMLA